MADITPQMVSELRESTGVGIMDCKKALTEASGDLEKAKEILRKKGMNKAAQKSGRATTQGLIHSYIHGVGKLGVMLELSCETDFVARTEQFAQLAKEIAMQAAAANPLWIKREDVPPEFISKEKEIYRAQLLAEKKPENVIDKIIIGKLEKYFSEVCLLDQPHIRDSSGKTKVKDLIDKVVGQLGENIAVRRFTRYILGE
ncbi:MAG: translation elongation factor Ts [Elusimicrobiota bacterium]